MTITEERFRLDYSKRAAKVTGYTADENGRPLTPILERDEERWPRVPKTPATFHPKYGTYAEIAKEAERLNKIQMTSGFLDHLYHPEVATSKPADELSDKEWLDTLAKVN